MLLLQNVIDNLYQQSTGTKLTYCNVSDMYGTAFTVHIITKHIQTLTTQFSNSTTIHKHGVITGFFLLTILK